MPDLPLPKPAPTSQDDLSSGSSKITNIFKSAITGNPPSSKPSVAQVAVLEPKSSQQAKTDDVDLGPKEPALSESSLPKPKTSGFIPIPPPAAVTALSSMSNNQPPPQTLVDNPDLPMPNRGPVRATSSLPVVEKIDKTPLPPVATGDFEKKVVEAPVDTQPKAKFAKPSQSILRFLPMVVGGLLLLLLVILIASKIIGGGQGQSVKNSSGGASNGSGSSGSTDETGQNTADGSSGDNSSSGSDKVTLEYWGLWESEPNMEAVIKEFEQKNPGIVVQYVKQSHKDYRERLQTAIASGNGPDIFRFHASWVPMMVNNLTPVPSSVYSTAQFKETFYPVAASQLQSDGQIVGIPLMYDGLMLYYNTDIFTAAGEKAPTTWAELRVLANKLTLRDGGEIKRAGAALGNAANVEHFSDIIALLMLQNGADLFRPSSPEGRDALLFYTNFVTKDKVWNEYMPNSTLAFARGDAAMMLAPSWRAHEIVSINPELKFATAPLPQLSNTKITLATYWAEGVNKQSTNKEAAWKLLAFLSSTEGQQKMYAAQAETRGFGEPYARVELAESLANHSILGSLMQDAPTASGWYMSSFTHDNGLNDQIIKYYETAVGGVIQGNAIQTVLSNLETGVGQVLAQFGVSVPL